MRELCGFVVGFVAAWLLAAALAHAESVGRVGADGGYHYHDAEWAGIWIPRECCGKSDCNRANLGDGYTADRLEDGSGYVVGIPQAGGASSAFFLAWDDPQVGPAEDGNYWVCTRWDTYTATKMPRCVFTPPLGF